jgi:hypothetical protein
VLYPVRTPSAFVEGTEFEPCDLWVDELTNIQCHELVILLQGNAAPSRSSDLSTLIGGSPPRRVGSCRSPALVTAVAGDVDFSGCSMLMSESLSGEILIRRAGHVTQMLMANARSLA